MKQIVVLLILVILTDACSINRKSRLEIFKVTVINNQDNSPIDSARVSFISVIDSRDVYENVKYTDTFGHCSFAAEHDPLAQYQLKTTKNGFLGYFDKSYAALDRSFVFITENTGNNIVLYLTSDSLNHINYWKSITVRYPVDSLVVLLKSNKYPLQSAFPFLVWDDIPALLSIGNNSVMINKFPINLLSSTIINERYLGIIALWFVESDRITELKKTFNPAEKFPSLTPTLQLKDHPERTENTIAIMNQAFTAYMTWWNQVKNRDRDEACKINPLENTGLEWR